MKHLENKGDRRGLNPRQLEPQSRLGSPNAYKIDASYVARWVQSAAQKCPIPSIPVPGTSIREWGRDIYVLLRAAFYDWKSRR